MRMGRCFTSDVRLLVLLGLSAPIEAYTRSLPAATATPLLPGLSRPQAQVMSLC